MADKAANDLFETDRAVGEPQLVVDVDGFEGPLDLLLELARRQKVDLTRISILALADQYLIFIEAARKLRLELAADYLVMAAWLAYLKSRLLLPEKNTPEAASAADLASDLAMRLRRLEAMRLAARRLAERDQLGREIFARGMPEPTVVVDQSSWDATLYDLLQAYAKQRQKHAGARVHVRRRVVWALADAREALQRLIGRALDWTSLDDYLMRYTFETGLGPTVRASGFAATLEMVREGQFELRQDKAFAPIFVRGRAA
jgi:segregation and condensation protein A